MSEFLFDKIRQAFLEKHVDECMIHPNDVGRTFENFITKEKADFAVSAIEFTIDYLEKTRGR